MKADLLCDIDHEVQIVDDLGTVNLDQQAAKCRISGSARHRSVPLPGSPRNETGMLIERSTGPAVQEGSASPRRRVRSRMRTAAKMRILVIGDEIGRGNHTQAGCRIRTSASAPPGARVRTLTSADTIVRASRPSAPRPRRPQGSEQARRQQRRQAGAKRPGAERRLQGGSIAIPYSSPICRTAFTIIDSGWPMTRTLPLKCFLTRISRMLPTSSRRKTRRGRRGRVVARPECGQFTGLAAFAGDETKILESIGKKGPRCFLLR